MSNIREELDQFLGYLWGNESPDGKPTYVYLPVKEASGKWTKYTFAWPRSRQGVIDHILAMSAQGCDVYFSPALYKAARPIKENVKGSWALWVDLDGNAPDAAPAPVPEPSLIVQSSLPGHEHWYWRLDEFLPNVEVIEERNRSIAYVLGDDLSGWDSSQVLRPPGTTNYKRNEPVVVKAWGA